ncbi:MAG: flavodoxin [Prevotellaceae bacterium]|nr:flavodoxin [Prevotellaceae bacterium]
MIKLLFMMAVVFAMPFSLYACSGDGETMKESGSRNSPDGEEETFFKNDSAFVVYYSWSGNTRHVAQRLAHLLGAASYEIRTVKAYPQDGRETAVISQEERRTGNLPEIVGDLPDLSAYKVIFIGAPIWNFYLPTPLERYMELTDFAGKTLVPFSTSMGSGQRGYLNDFNHRAQNTQEILGYKDFQFPNNYSPDAFSDAELDSVLSEWLHTLNL